MVHLATLTQIERDQVKSGICADFSSSGGISIKPAAGGAAELRRFFPARGLAITTALARWESQVSIFAGKIDNLSERDYPAEKANQAKQ